jgi:2-dehydropantoate 2-reductase
LEASKPFDYIICTHKATNTAAIPGLFRSVADDSTTFVIIQNGVGNELPFRTSYPRNTIISCVTWVGASQPRSGLIKHTSAEDMQIGLYDNPAADSALDAESLKNFATLLEEGKTIFQVVDDIQKKRWEKVVWNAAWNPLTTLTLVDTKTWLESSDQAYTVTVRMMHEMIDIAQRCDVPLTYGLADELMAKVKTMGRIGSSMQQDAKAGRPLEVDVILGYPVQKAREFGMDTPILDTVFALTTAVHHRIVETGS